MPWNFLGVGVTKNMFFQKHAPLKDPYMDVSKNNGTPKLSILIGFSILNHPFWGTSIFGNTHLVVWDGDVLSLPQLQDNVLQNMAISTDLCFLVVVTSHFYFHPQFLVPNSHFEKSHVFQRVEKKPIEGSQKSPKWKGLVSQAPILIFLCSFQTRVVSFTLWTRLTDKGIPTDICWAILQPLLVQTLV